MLSSLVEELYLCCLSPELCGRKNITSEMSSQLLLYISLIECLSLLSLSLT